MKRFEGCVSAIEGQTFHLKLEGGKEMWVKPTPELPSDFGLSVGQKVEVFGDWFGSIYGSNDIPLFGAREVVKR